MTEKKYPVGFGISLFLAVTMGLLFSTAAYSQKAVPELWGQRVHDEAKVLSQGTIDQLESRLKKYEDSTTNQIAILIVKSLDGAVLEEYSMQVVEKWKLGTSKNDNGVLLLIAVDDHKMRIEVGHGLEGVLTDAHTNRIIRNEMAPHFRRGEYDAGVLAAVDGITRAIAGEYKADPVKDQDKDKGKDGITGTIFLGLFLFGFMGIFLYGVLFTKGCGSWFMWAFFIPVWATFPSFVVNSPTSIALLAIYVIAVPIAKIIMPRTAWGKRNISEWEGSSGGSSSGGSSSSSSWSSSSGSSSRSSSSSSFSGGGGSFGGGGSSGTW